MIVFNAEVEVVLIIGTQSLLDVFTPCFCADENF